MATHYSYTFESQPISGATGKTYKVLIRDTDYTGTDEVILLPDSDGFTMNWEGPTSETYQPFITSTVSIGLYIDANVRQLISDIIKGNEAKFTVVIYEITLSTSAPKWQGIVLREEITVPDATEAVITITANDGFGLLKDSQYTYTSGNSRTLLDYLAEISTLLKHDKNLLVTQPCWRLASVWFEDSKATTDDPLGLNQIDEAAFATVDDFGVTVTKSYYEILEQFLIAFNLQISQWNGVFMLIQQNSYGSYTTVHYWDYAYDGASVDDDDLTLLADMPDRFEGGSYSYVLPCKEVAAEYEFKQGIYNNNLLPYNVNPDTEYSIGISSGSDIYTVSGTVETTYNGDGGAVLTLIQALYRLSIKAGTYYIDTAADGTLSWSTTPVNYYKFYSNRLRSNGSIQINANGFSLITPPVPAVDLAVSVQWEFIGFVEYPYTDTAYTPGAGYTIAYDDIEGSFIAIVNSAESQEGKLRFKTTVSNSALAVLELPNAVIGDGPNDYSAGSIAVDVSGTFENSDLWQIYGLTASTNYPLHSLRCLEMLALRRYLVPLYSGNFFGAPDIHKSVEFNEYGGATESWIWTSVNWKANLMAYTGTLMQIKTSRASITINTPLLEESQSGSGGGGGGTTDPTAPLSLAAIGSAPNANGATLSGGVLNLQPANETYGGVLTAIQQLVAGEKDFISGLFGIVTKAYDGSADIGMTLGLTPRTAVKNGVAYQYRWFVYGKSDGQKMKLQYLKYNSGGGSDSWSDVGIEVDTTGKLTIATDILNAPDITAVNDFTIKTGSQKTLVLEEPVWIDIDFPIIIRTTGPNIPTMTAINGNLTLPKWAVNDFNMCESQELIHSWKEGTECFWHLHLTTNGSDLANRYVKFELEYGYSNGDVTAWTFPAVITTADLLIPGGTADKTMFILNLGSFTPSSAKIGGHVIARLKRVTATGTAPTGDPWIPMLQMHVQCDTQGSRQIGTK
jgi:hypothetical protein